MLQYTISRSNNSHNFNNYQFLLDNPQQKYCKLPIIRPPTTSPNLEKRGSLSFQKNMGSYSRGGSQYREQYTVYMLISALSRFQS
ncbi:hypothetical protein TTHERM_01081620 (macronuclear) [Tetrahymena thermophila SB210]|uniref:Uncharacterized protein n=1 Tax=Tetrahymena thermophila (strain SB210) TaxID=312017 RepID=Q22C07_TETTS|nr:hypothetical protein TTHERM_01081620 [Tetrahymena thermophila SB210]EAR82802.1 hypothetical protein TTHERM_01081620 [Tetrahymena thermophila SB210]|eukprot:XP_001030465.1 hypothetical protein TTHERM_01081620 [Tetrahymena thermophila SB210]